MDKWIDDVGFIDQLLWQLPGRFGADPQRIFLSGKSAGGVLVHAALCKSEAVASKVRVAVDVLGGLPEPMAQACAPRGETSVLLIHGEQDEHLPWSRRVVLDYVPFLSKQDAASFWRSVGGRARMGGGSAAAGGRGGAAVPPVHALGGRLAARAPWAVWGLTWAGSAIAAGRSGSGPAQSLAIIRAGTTRAPLARSANQHSRTRAPGRPPPPAAGANFRCGNKNLAPWVTASTTARSTPNSQGATGRSSSAASATRGTPQVGAARLVVPCLRRACFI
jgi:hypothetical protein